MIVHLTDPDDPRLADYTRLTDVALRRTLEVERGLFMAESSQVIARAVDAGHRPRSFLMAPRWLEAAGEFIARAPGTGGDPQGGDVPVFVAPEELMTTITGFHLHRGALAAMQRPVLPSVGEVLEGVEGGGAGAGARGSAGGRRVAVLEDAVDHTNVGAMFRSAAALGIDAVLVTPRCADPLYRRSVRVSMGAVFQVPWTRIESWPGGVDVLKEHDYVVAGMTLGEGAITLDELVAERHEHLALVFGTEGHGITPQADRRLDRHVTIPMTHGVDSLNVAAASAVAFYATGK